MKITRKFWAVLAALVLGLGLAGCSDGSGLDDEGGIGLEKGVMESGSGEGRFEEDRPDGHDEMKIGGFSVQGPEDEEISIPEAEARPGDVEEYVTSVVPMLDDSILDFSSLVGSDADLQGETANLSLNADSVKDALETNEESLEELQNLETPGGLDDVHDALVDSRERAVSAYDNINQAFIDDESSDEVADTVEENLPEIEYSNAETRAILQELERASDKR